MMRGSQRPCEEGGWETKAGVPNRSVNRLARQTMEIGTANAGDEEGLNMAAFDSCDECDVEPSLQRNAPKAILRFSQHDDVTRV